MRCFDKILFQKHKFQREGHFKRCKKCSNEVLGQDIFAKRDYQLLEICTSDTHYAPVKARNRNGYYQLGLITSAEKLSRWFFEIAKSAENNTASAKFEILENESNVKVMGQGIYEDYSKALDNSLKITKGFVIGCLILFVTSLFL